MDKNHDIDDSFEIYDPIVNSISDSMSIVPIPEPIPQQMISCDYSRPTIETNSLDRMANILDTTRMDSADGPPNYDQIQEQELIAQKMSNNSGFKLTEEKNQSLQKLSDNLNRIENNSKNCSNGWDQMLSNNLETYLRELKDENEKLKIELEKYNHSMKQQLKSLHEWQTKNNEVIEQHKQVVKQSELFAQENQCLKGDNERLKDKVAELEGMTGLVEQLTAEVQTLRSRCQSMANYEKFDVSSELKTQELNSRLVDSQLKIDAMTTEMNALKRQLNATASMMNSLPAMESQLHLYERDFKIEEMAKLAALKEVNELEEEIESLKLINNQLEERVEKGVPALEIKDDSVGRRHRRSHSHRHSGKLGRPAIPVPSVGAVLKGFKQYKTTSNNV